MLFRSFVLMLCLITVSPAETIYVKYRGNVDVDNGHFSRLQLKNSHLVKDMYYDSSNEYLLVRLKNTYYHYCSIPNNVVDMWVKSSSLGKFYKSFVKGNYDCRIYPIPSY